VRIRRTPGRGAGSTSVGGAERTVSAGKRSAIVRAATELFLHQGYAATSTEQIATIAAVSKQTVYNQFGDKETLFRDIILGVTATAEAFVDDLPEAFAGITTPAEVEPALRTLARRYLAAVTQPQVLALRRLVISEATRFPDLAAAYYRLAPARVLTALRDQLHNLAGRGLLILADPDSAAADFAFLLLGRSLDRDMFHVQPTEPEPTDNSHGDLHADHAVEVFLAAYRAR
jgi:TetR/AcrR family transcriptional repressor of mexJK operon